MSFLKKFSPRTFDWWLFMATLFLVILGVTAIYSVDLSRGSNLVLFRKQLFASLIGLALLFAGSVSQYTLWRYSAKWWYFLSALLLAAVLIFGQTIRGTKGWFVFPYFSIQPVEVAKIGLILMLAHIISRFGKDFYRPLFFIGTGCVALALIILTVFQPDLGSAVLLGILWFGLMWLVGARKTYLISFIIIIVATCFFAWFLLLQNYQRERLITFVNPEKDPLGAGYNVTQSIIAVGAGRLFGRGLGFGSQSQLRFLPEAQTDFVFAVIAEELGFAGAAVLFILYGIIFWRLITLMRDAKDGFNEMVIAGILILLFSQFFINIGATIGILPITGITLPFVSYGGSSLVASLLLIGIAESMRLKKYVMVQ